MVQKPERRQPPARRIVQPQGIVQYKVAQPRVRACDMMSAMGQKQTSGEHNRMSALPPKADIRVTHRHGCFGFIR
jgi:hypothetical protein